MKLGKITRAEVALLAVTAVFLCVLTGLWLHDRAAPPVAVETETQVPQEEILPDMTPVDINAAPAEVLAELPGIGPELAARIVAHRQEHGPFPDTAALTEVRGIGEGKLRELEGRIAALGPDGAAPETEETSEAE